MASRRPTQNQYDYLAKAIIVGDTAVGKSNILLRYSKHEYRPSHLTTIGVDFTVKTMKVQGAKIKVQIWDTAGQEKYKAITETYFRGSHAALLVYSVTSKRSFTSIENWIRQISSNEGPIKMVLVANKCDISSEREVSFQEGQQLARQHSIPFFQCSAKENINIQEVFSQVGESIYSIIKVNQEQSKHKGFQIERKPSSHSSCQC